MVINKQNILFLLFKDGSDNVPVITHKIGSIQETLFEDIIKIISENAFTNNNFPIIL